MQRSRFAAPITSERVASIHAPGAMPSAGGVLLIASVLLGFGGDIARAADGTWIEIPPPTRRDHTAIHDPARDRMLVFGGSEGDVLRLEVFALSLSTAAWTEVQIEGPGPSARIGHSAVYDPGRDRMLVFGGWDGTFLNDVWALSLSGPPQWTPIAAGGSPPNARSGHTAVYDPVIDRMLVFGGWSPWAPRNDTWALSLAGTPAWTQLSPSGTLPSARSSHSAIVDPIRRRMLVFAGDDGGSYLNDLWSLSLEGDPSWTAILPPGPLPFRTHEHIAVYDVAHDRMIVDGGSIGLYGMGDCWALPLAAGASWERFPMHNRWNHSAIYDPLRDAVVVYGGLVLDGNDNATLRLVLDPPPQWEYFSNSGTAVPRQLAAATIYDPIDRRMILFGGLASGCIDPCPSGATVSYSLSGDHQWTWLTQGPARYDHSAIYDPVRRRMVVFGGDEFYWSRLNDTWVLSLPDASQWDQVFPTGSLPAARRAHTAVYDPGADRMLVFGGTDASWEGGTLFNDVWELAFAGEMRWTLLTPIGVPPSARESHTAIYDPDSERMIVFGGRDASGLKNDLWALSLSGVPEWSPIAAEGLLPTPRAAHTALYDPLRLRMVVFGGTPDGDVWVLNLTGAAAWSPFDAAGVTPSGREDHTAIYDAPADHLVVCGGWSDGPWQWLGSSAVTLLAFGEIAAVPAEASSPPGILFHGARPNPASGAFEVLFESAGAVPTALELIEVTGRRLVRRDLGTPPAGSHLVRFEDVQLPAGTYFLRLTQAGRSITSKISIVP